MTRLVMCPYDEAHKVKVSGLQKHITNCKLNHLNDKKFICQFNSTHVLPCQKKDDHLAHCPDRAPLDRRLAEGSLDKNNPYRGRIAVPSYNESPVVVSEEVWDLDPNPTPGFKPPSETPAGVMFVPPPLSKPAERRRMYKNLHVRPDEDEDRPAQTVAAAASPVIPKQPIALKCKEVIGKREDLFDKSFQKLNQGPKNQDLSSKQPFPSTPNKSSYISLNKSLDVAKELYHTLVSFKKNTNHRVKEVACVEEVSQNTYHHQSSQNLLSVRVVGPVYKSIQPPVFKQPLSPPLNPSKHESMQNFPNVGKGRGTSKRIAANIFTEQNRPGSTNRHSYNVDAVSSNMSQLGLGRGASNHSIVPNQLDEDEFPALGCSRGMTRTPRNISYAGIMNGGNKQ